MSPLPTTLPRRTRGLVRTALVGSGLAAAGLLTVGLVGCDSFFYRPNTVDYGTRRRLDLTVEEVWFAAPDGPRLHGWWLPAEGPTRGTIVFCHGNTGNLTGHAAGIRWLPRQGFQVLLFDYRGYGQSEGEITRAGTVADAVAAIDFALQRDPERTCVFGHSLGGAIGIVAAHRRPAVRGIIAESTFPSYRAAASATVPWCSWLVPLLVSSGQDPIDVIGEIAPRPLLVIHGTRDRITPLALGEALYAAAREPKTLDIVEGGGHATPWYSQGPAFETRVVGFLSSALARPSASERPR